jgi:hypothetical protein
MKNMHKEFDKELAERLYQYTEEPPNELWNKIALAARFKEKDALWISWSNYSAGAILFVSALWMIYAVAPAAERRDQAYAMGMSAETDQGSSSPNAPGTPAVHVNPRPGSGKNLEPPSSGVSAATPVTMGVERKSVPKTAEKKGSAARDEVSYGSAVFTEAPIEPKSSSPAPKLLVGSIHSRLDTTIVFMDKAGRTVTVEGPRKKIRGNQFSMYFMAMPALNYQLLDVSQADPIQIDSVYGSSAGNIGQMGFRAELGIEVPWTKRLTAFAGLVYFHRNRIIRYTELTPGPLQPVSLPGGGTALVPQITTQQSSFQDEARNLGIQLGVLFKLSSDKHRILSAQDALNSETMKPKKRLVHFVGLGMEIQKSLGSTSSPMSETLHRPSLYAFTSFYYRVQYPDAGRLRFFAQPMVGYLYYASETKDSPFQLKPLSVGLNLGCTYRMR